MQANRPMRHFTQPEIEQALLANAKEFLRQRLEGHAPDALLTQQWEEFHRVYSAFLHQMATRFGLDAQETEDLIQAVWLEVCLHLPEVNSPSRPSGLRAWLFTLIRNQALKFLRWKQRHPVQLLQNLDANELIGLTAGPADQADEACDRELLDVLLTEMQKEVPAEHYRLLILRLVEGRSAAEAAQALGLSAAQFKERQKYLFRTLRGKVALYQGVPCDRLGTVSSAAVDVF